MNFSITLNRIVDRQTNPDNIKSYLDKFIKKALNGPRGNGWNSVLHRSEKPVQNNDGRWIYTQKITFKKTAGKMGSAPSQWNQICKALIQTCQSGQFSQRPWLVSGENSANLYQELLDEGKVAPLALTEKSNKIKSESIPVLEDKLTKSFSEINTDLGNHFDHIYGREHQIKIIHSSLVAAKESDFQNRFHCVLQGSPGCAKSDILKSVGNMLGKENEAYMILDATSTTEAGAQRILLESKYIPPVLIVEEIEKTDEKSLRWLLGILDHRAEIRKTNFKIGHRAKNVRMLCLATVNNIALFKKAMSGALYSRFAHSIYCPRPTRDVMQKILEREIAKINGRQEWIEPALKFCMDEQKIDDPRKIIPVCICGRDDLLTGRYQESLLAVQKPRKKVV